MSDIYKAAGIIIKDRKLLVERSKGKEFFVAPGGKLNPGETAVEALLRELKEEFQIVINKDDVEPFGTFSAAAANSPERQVHMEVFVVKQWQNEITPDSEIEEIRWLTSDIEDGLPVGSIFEHEVIPRLKKANLID